MKKIFVCLSAGLLGLGSISLTAGTLTYVPMQGGMVMPMVAYHAEHGHLHVMMTTNVPQLTPSLASHPADGFDPGDPWFDSVDPSRQGAAFSRRYGFMMDNSDPLPANTQIWIRKLSGSPELKAYRYAQNAPKAWEPIFGTDGVTNALYWNGDMFHPAFTAPPGTNPLTATFEFYLVDTNTGLEVPDSSSGPVVLNWTNVPDGRPTLNLTQRVVIQWPAATTTNWVLEVATTPDATTWTTVTNPPVVVAGQPAVVLDGGAAQQFYRMRYLP
jgi:hypothetical protein